MYVIVVNIIPTDSKHKKQRERQNSPFERNKFHRWWKNVLKVTSPFRRCVNNTAFGKWPREGLLIYARWKNKKTMLNVNKNFILFLYAFHRPICSKWMIFNQIPHEKQNLSTYEISTWQHRNILYDFYSFVDSYHKSYQSLYACSFVFDTSQLWNKNRVSALTMT